MENRRKAVAIAVVAFFLLAVPAVMAAQWQGQTPTGVSDPEQSDLSPSLKLVSAEYAAPGDILEYMFEIFNVGIDPTFASLEDELPEGLDFVQGSEWASSGFVSFADGSLYWEGDVFPLAPAVQVGFEATVNPLAAAGQPIVNHALLQDIATGGIFPLDATTIGTTHFTGLDNPGKIAVDGGGIGGGEGGCGPWECMWYECTDPCDEWT